MNERLDPKALREAAQARLAADQGGTLEELHVHQVELEMQHQELQRIYEELEASNRRFRGLFDDAPFPYVETDRRGDITQYNRAAQNLLGIGVDQPLRDLVAAPQRGAFDELLDIAASSQASPPSREFLLRTVRGERYVRISISCPEEGRALFALEDVTQVRAAREQLAASERRMRSFFDLAPDGIAVMRDTSVVYVNRALCALLQARPDDLMHEGLRNLVMSDRDIFASTEVPEIEFVLRDLEGGEHAVEARTVEIELDSRPARMWMIRDLTERRRMEARVARSERLASFGMLVSGVAHEINNPLSFVIANLEMIIETLEETADEDTLELAKDALEGGSRIATIVNDLRSFQRTDDELGPVDVNEVVARTLRMAQPKVAHTTRIRQALGLVPSVVSNEGRLAQVLLNLVLNAAQAMPERPMEDNRVEVRTWTQDGEVCLLVEDNGKGIPKDKLRYLFDPFFTTRKHSGGTGLGLAISNGIVQQMGGFIDVQSEVGKGSRFVVHLPISRTASESKIRRPPTLETQAPPTDEMRILVVDDEPAVARVLVRTLKSFGPVTVLDSGRAAQAHLTDRADYHVILCDLVMDNGSGDELLRWLNEAHPRLVPRIAFMSGMPHPEQRTPGKRPLLHKPFDLATVRKVVRSIGNRALRDETAEQPETPARVDLSGAQAFPPTGG